MKININTMMDITLDTTQYYQHTLPLGSISQTILYNIQYSEYCLLLAPYLIVLLAD